MKPSSWRPCFRLAASRSEAQLVTKEVTKAGESAFDWPYLNLLVYCRSYRLGKQGLELPELLARQASKGRKQTHKALPCQQCCLYTCVVEHAVLAQREKHNTGTQQFCWRQSSTITMFHTIGMQEP